MKTVKSLFAYSKFSLALVCGVGLLLVARGEVFHTMQRGLSLSAEQVATMRPTNLTANRRAALELNGALEVPQTVLAGGGGTSKGGTFTVHGTTGQPLTDTSSGGQFRVSSGFWMPEAIAAPCPTIALAPATLPNGTAGMAYHQPFTASGGSGAYSFSLSGHLPAGLTLTNDALTGTPTATGTFNFTVQAQDANGCAVTQPYALRINCPSLMLAPALLPAGQMSVFYQQTLSVSGGLAPIQFSLLQGALPTGITLSATGVISGTTTTVGSFHFSVQAQDAAGCLTTGVYTLSVSCPGLSLGALPKALAGSAYNAALSVHPVGAYQFSSTDQPAGLTLTSNGSLSGTPTVAGVFNFNVSVTGPGTCTQTFVAVLTVTCPTLSINPTALPNAILGTAYHQVLSAAPGNGHSFNITNGALPNGLTLNNNGTFSGTPTAAGSFNFTVTATAFGSCTNMRAFTLTITGTCAPITISPVTLLGGSVGTAYSQMLTVTGGTAPYSFSIANGALPKGLALDPATGLITGLPETGGTFSVTLRATSQGGCTGQRLYVISIACGALIFSPATLPAGTKGLAYSQQLAVSPAGSYTFNLQLGQLPPGFTLNSAGLVSGITTQSGSYNFTIKALAGSCQNTKAYTLVISNGAAALALNADYDGDGLSDTALWSPEDSLWRVFNSGTQQVVTQRWGAAGDLTLLGDYDGDGKTDLAVFRPADATFYIKPSGGGGFIVKQWGLATDVPVPGDYDGDGKTDIAVWRGSNGTWYIVRSSDGLSETSAWGASALPYSDLPVPGDYDGDGRSDVAVFRRGNGAWLIKRSRDGQYSMKPWGVGTDVPVAHDYDGDGQTDCAVWRPAEGRWYVWQSATDTAQVLVWGAGQFNDQTLPGDYDGDGKADAAVWRPAEHTWYVKGSRAAAVLTKTLGLSSDHPVPGKPTN